MSNKGITQSALTKYKISDALQTNRTKILLKLKEYKKLLLDQDHSSLIPSIVSASLYAGMSKKALLAWEITTAENSELRALLDFVRDFEEKYLRENGLLGKTDSKLTTTLLKADHGLQEKPPQLTQNNTFNVSPDILAEALELSRAKKPSDSKG